jgi:peptide/nickel transport system permease protein
VGRFILKRLVFMGVVLLVLSMITFFLTTIAPSDPAALWVGDRPKAGQIERARELLGLNKPVHIRYFHYVSNIVKGDFGTSIRTKLPVSDDLEKYFPATIELVTVALFISLICGIPLGVFTAFHREKLSDHLGRLFSLAGVAVPIFWLGMMFQITLGSGLKWLPIQGRLSSTVMLLNPIEHITGFFLVDSLITANYAAFYDAAIQMILPALTLSFASLAYIVRITRSSLIEVLQEDYIRTSEAYGVSQGKIRYKYALKNGMIPVITVVGLAYAYQIGGSILVESIFDWPGMGKYMWLSIINNDYPGVMGVTLIFAAICCTINLLVDLLYAVIDPRVRASGL